LFLKIAINIHPNSSSWSITRDKCSNRNCKGWMSRPKGK